MKINDALQFDKATDMTERSLNAEQLQIFIKQMF
jgi:hypothetical protein